MDDEKQLIKLYEGMKADNYDVPDTYDRFEYTLTEDGDEGANSRRALYKSLKEQHYDVPDTYDGFYRTYFVPVSGTRSIARGGAAFGNGQPAVNDEKPDAQAAANAMGADIGAAVTEALGNGQSTIKNEKPDAQPSQPSPGSSQPSQPLPDGEAGRGLSSPQGRPSGATVFVPTDPNVGMASITSPDDPLLKQYPWLKPGEQFYYNKQTNEPLYTYAGENGEAITPDDYKVRTAQAEITGERQYAYKEPAAPQLDVPVKAKGVRPDRSITAYVDQLMRKQYGDDYADSEFNMPDGTKAKGSQLMADAAQATYDDLNADLKAARMQMLAAGEGEQRQAIYNNVAAKWRGLMSDATLRKYLDDEDAAREDVADMADARLAGLQERKRQLQAEMDKRGEQLDKQGSAFNDNALYNARAVDGKYSSLMAEMTALDNTIASWQAVREGKGAGLKRAMANTMGQKGSLDFGMNDLNTGLALLTATGERRKRLVDALGGEQAAANLEDKLTTDWYRWMKVALESAKYTPDFIFGGGLIDATAKGVARQGSKLIVRQGLKGLQRNVVKNLGVGLGKIAASYALSGTIQAGKTAADIIKRKTGADEITQNDDGSYSLGRQKGWAEAAYKGATASAIENFTEVLDPKVGGFVGKFLKERGLGRVTDFFVNLGKSQPMKLASDWLRRMRVTGYVGEVLEEEAAIPLNALLVGDNPMFIGEGGLLDKRTQADILGGVLLSVAGMQAVAAGGAYATMGARKAAWELIHAADKRGLADADRRGTELYGGLRWSGIRRKIDEAENKDMSKVTYEILEGEADPDKKRAVADYCVKTINLRGHNLGMNAVAEAEALGNGQPAVDNENPDAQPSQPSPGSPSAPGSPTQEVSYTATMYPDASKGETEPHEVTVTKGNLALRDDGTVDVAASDKEIYYQGADGQTHMAAPDKFSGRGTPIAADTVQPSQPLPAPPGSPIAPTQEVAPTNDADAQPSQPSPSSSQPSQPLPVGEDGRGLSAPQGRPGGAFIPGDDVSFNLEGQPLNGTYNGTDEDGNAVIDYEDAQGNIHRARVPMGQLTTAGQEAMPTDDAQPSQPSQPSQPLPDTPSASSQQPTQDQEPQPVGKNRFGNIYKWTLGRFQSAASFLGKIKSGYLKGVFHRNGLGDIDMVWGNDKAGLQHIIRKHIEEADDFSSIDEAMQVIDDTITNGDETRQGSNISFDYKGYRVSVAQSEEGNWVITAFDTTRSREEKRKGKGNATIGDQSESDMENGTLVSPQLAPSAGKDTQNPNTAQAPVGKNAIPTDQKGRPLYQDAPVEATIADLYDGQLTDAEIAEFVEANIKEAERKYAQVQKKAPKMTTDKAEYISKKQQWQRDVDEARRLSDHWHAVDTYIKERTHTTADELDAQQAELTGDAAREEYAAMHSDDTLPTPVQAAADFIRGARITPESFRRETGMSQAEQRKYIGMIANADNGGRSIERLAEELVSFDDAETGGVLFRGDTNEARSAIIDALLSMGTRSGMSRQAAMSAEADRHAEYVANRRDEYYMEMFHMTYEEYLDYSEQQMPDIWRKYANFDERAFLDMYADEIIESLNQRNDDTTTEEQGADTGHEVLHRPRPDNGEGDTGGTQYDEEVPTGVRGSHEDAALPEGTRAGAAEEHTLSPQDSQPRQEVIQQDPRQMSDEEKQRRGEMLRDAEAVDVAEGQIVATSGMSARKAAEKWWDEHVPEPQFYDTEAGEVEINKDSVENSLAHRYGQAKLDAITSLVEGFENAVYLGTMPDSRERGVVDHYFAYPITYNGKRCYVFCRAMQDANKNRLYVHEVFVADRIRKGDTLQTAASKPHGGIALYRDIIANVLETPEQTNSRTDVDSNHEGLSDDTATRQSSGVSASKDSAKSPTAQGKDAKSKDLKEKVTENIDKGQKEDSLTEAEAGNENAKTSKEDTEADGKSVSLPHNKGKENGIPQQVSQGEHGTLPEEDRRMAEVSNGVARGSRLYEEEHGGGRADVAGLFAEQRAAERLAKESKQSEIDDVEEKTTATANTPQAEGQRKEEDNAKPSFLDVVKSLYSKGKSIASKLYQRSFFDVATTPGFMKELGLTGDKFTIRYGVIARHFGKDSSHNLTEDEWEQLPKALTNPFAITRLSDKDNSYRIYTSLITAKGEYVVVGVDVKNAGRDIEVNAIATVFGRRNDANIPENEEVIYRDKEITPKQSSLLERPNSAQYPTSQGLSVGKDRESSDSKQGNQEKSKPKEEKNVKTVSSRSTKNNGTEKIDDVGEKIGGAKKSVSALRMPMTEDEFSDKRMKEIMSENPGMDEDDAWNKANDEYPSYIGEKIKSGELEELYAQLPINGRIKLSNMVETAGFELSDISGDYNKKRKEEKRNNTRKVGQKVEGEYYDGSFFVGNIIKIGDGKVTVLSEIDGRKYQVPESLVSDATTDSPRLQKSDGTQPSAKESAIRDAVVDRLRESGIEVITDTEEAQRVLDEANGKVRLMGSRVKKRMDDIGRHYSGKDLSPEEKAVVNVFSGMEDRYTFRFDTSRGTVNIEMQQGNENHSGTKHSLYRHYGTNTGYYDAAEVAFIPEIIKTGTRNEDGKKAVYTKTINGVLYKVVTEIKDKKEVFNDFYTNRKAKTSKSSNTPLGARTDDISANPATKVRKNTETTIENEGKIREHRVYHGSDVRFLRTPSGEAYGFTVGGRIYIDPRIATAETPIHEYAHLWASALRQANPAEWQNVVALMKGTPVWDDVKKRYPELTTDEDIADEVLATYSGRRGAERLLDETRKVLAEGGGIADKARAVKAIGRVREALRRFWKAAADFLHIHYTTAEEVADRVMRDMLEGVNPRQAANELLSESQVDDLLSAMKAKAIVASHIEADEGNWRPTFDTPIGVVKMGENQKAKLLGKGRADQYGMLVNTLLKPDIIIEERDKDDSLPHERATSYLFVKTFQKEDGSKYVHFESVTVSQDGLEVSISSHILRENQLRKKMKSDKLLYKATALDESANSSAEQPVNKGGSLSSAAKIVEDFENPSVSDENLREASNHNVNGSSEVVEFAHKYNLNEKDVSDYAEAMERGNLNAAARAFHEIRRKVRIDNSGATFKEFVRVFKPIRESLYAKFGNIDELREQYVQEALAERNAMEAARKRAEEAAEAERRRLQEFRDMPDDQLDDEYMKTVDANDESRMRDLVNEAARRNGYADTESGYQGEGAWAAPSNPGYESDAERRAALEESGTDINVSDIAEGISMQPDDYFTNLRAYGNDTPHGRESAETINKAMTEVRKGRNPKIKVYRAVPKTVKEGKLRNGDWVTPSRKYAQMHGEHRLEGDYRIIEQEVPANELWWDGNDINEWGFDDGKRYAYRNTRNNRKLNDLITRDDNGQVIPLSQRFNARKSDVRFSRIPSDELEEVNERFNEELSRYQDGQMDKNEMFHLGNPHGVMKMFLPDLPIVMRQRIVNKGSNRKHDVDVTALQDMPQMISNPIFVFKKSKDTLSVLTEMKDRNGRNVFVAFDVAATIQDGGNYLEVNDITTIHGRRVENIIRPINENDSLQWVDKKKALAWFSSASPNVQQEITQQELDSASKDSESSDKKQGNQEKSKPKKDGATTGDSKADDDVQYREESELEETNARFNEELDEFKEKRHKGLLHLGKPGSILRACGINKELTLSPTVLSRKLKQHGLDIEDLKGLAMSVQDPILVYKHGEGHPNIVVVTGLEAKGGRVSVSIELDADGNVVELNNISSVHGKDASMELERLAKMGEDGLEKALRWVDKKRVSDWLGIADLTSPIHTDNPKLESAAKIVEDFENPSVSDENNTVRLSKADDSSDTTAEGGYSDIREEYDRRTLSHGFKLREAAQDGMRSVGVLQEVIAQETGKPIAEADDVWDGQNRLPGMNKVDAESYEIRFYKPLFEAVGALQKQGARWNVEGDDIINAQDDICKYLIAKHGVERNRHFRDKAAAEARRPYEEKAAALRKQAENGEMKQQQADEKIDKLMQQADEAEQKSRVDTGTKDYSGLSSLFPKAGDFDAAAREYAEAFEAKFGNVLCGELWRRVNAATKETLRKAYEGGLMSRRAYDDVRSMYRYYIPLRGWGNDSAADRYNYAGGGNANGGGILKRAKGRTSLADNPLSMIGLMAQQTIEQANKNRMVYQRLYNLAADNPSALLTLSRQWYVNTGTKKNPVWERAYPELRPDMTADEVDAAVAEFNKRMKEKQKEGTATNRRDGLKITYHTTEAQERQHRVGVSLNGREYNVYVNGNPRAAQAINGELNSDNGLLERALKAANRWLSKVYTSLNLEFLVTNYQRDAVFATAIILATEPADYQRAFAVNMARFNPLTGINAVRLNRLMKEALEAGAVSQGEDTDAQGKYLVYMREFLFGGGETGFTNSLTADDYKRRMGRYVKDVNHPVSIGKAMRGWTDFVERSNRIFEDATRFAAYVTSREQGLRKPYIRFSTFHCRLHPFSLNTIHMRKKRKYLIYKGFHFFL